jgi:hypothetical protein
MTDLSGVFTAAMARPTVVSDIDGIIADWVSAACEAVNGHFGTGYTPMVWWSWAGPFSAEERDWLTTERHADSAFWMSLSPFGEMVDTLHELAALGYRLVLSSEMPAEQRAARTAWLEWHDVPYNELYLIGTGGKVALCSQSSDEYPVTLIDDNPQRWVDCALYPGVEILCPRRTYTPEIASERNVALYDHPTEIVGLIGHSLTWES